MLNSTNNNVDSEKWKEIVSDEIQSDIENYSDNELPLSSIVTTNNINTEKWQDITLDNIQSNMKNDSENELSLSSISTFNDNHRIPKHQEINLDDTQSDNENCLDNELPLSSIANVLLLSDSCKFEKSESIDYRSKLNVNHNTQSVLHQISTKDQSKIDTPMRRYGCDICGKIFLRRIAIIEHFRTSLCFPDSPFDFKFDSPNYYLCNNSEDSISFVNNINNLETNNMKATTYKCRVCQNVIRNNNLIKRQQILHTKENNLLCDICSVLNSIACGNNQHLKEKYTWKCKSCGQTFTKLSVLKTHRCIFPKNKLFNCYKCHKSYKNLNALEKHKIVHKLNCNICNKQFFKQSTLTDHKRLHYLKSINQPNIHLKYMNSSVLNTNKAFNTSKNYECSRCSELFHKRSEIISHIFENHREDYSKYSCDECTNFSDSSRDYILCLAKNHCKCDVCPQSFTTSHRLQQHYRWHLGINNFKCQFCPKTFSKCFLYLSHERTHTREKPFRCNFCGKWFPETSNLNIHLKPYKLFACNICQKSYTRMSSLLFHKRIHAKEKRQIKSCNQFSTLEVRTRRQYTRRKHFNCKLCAKSFFHSWLLSAHLKTHQNRKNVKKSSLNKHKRPQEDTICIKCNLCQESFSDQNILITHRCKSSTCKYCLKVFNNVSSLNRHYRYMHQKNNELFDCDICKISFMCSTSLNEHLKKHTLCDKNMPLTFNVTNEIKTAKEEMYLNEEYKCDICMKSFFSQTQIIPHILETHY